MKINVGKTHNRKVLNTVIHVHICHPVSIPCNTCNLYNYYILAKHVMRKLFFSLTKHAF